MNRSMVEQSVSTSFFSPVWDMAFWVFALFMVLFFAFYRLKISRTSVFSRIVIYIGSFSVVRWILWLFLA